MRSGDGIGSTPAIRTLRAQRAPQVQMALAVRNLVQKRPGNLLPPRQIRVLLMVVDGHPGTRYRAKIMQQPSHLKR